MLVCWLLDGCLLCVVYFKCCLLSVVGCLLVCCAVVCCVLLVVGCVCLLVVGWLLFLVCCLLWVVGWLLVVVLLCERWIEGRDLDARQWPSDFLSNLLKIRS